MQKLIKNYHNAFKALIDSISVTSNEGVSYNFFQGVDLVCNLIEQKVNLGNKIIIIGNGGSASISSHMAIDFLKNSGIRALSFNDGPLLTCIGNDLGYENVFKKPIEMHADKGDVLIAISSSGKSENILNGVRTANIMGCKIITLSGFEYNNPLNFMGNYNFHVPSSEYGPVEVAHQYICHCIHDILMKLKSKQHSKFNNISGRKYKKNNVRSVCSEVSMIS